MKPTPSHAPDGSSATPNPLRRESRLRVRFQGLLPILLLAACGIGEANAATYYVDATAGSDSNNGTSEATPWQTLTKVNDVIFLPGDNVLFKRDEVWNGTLYPKSGTTPATITQGSGSGPTNRVTFDAYGTGEKPIINGNGAPVTVQIINKQYFTFRNFHVTNIAPPGDVHPDNNRIGIRVAFGGTGAPNGVVHQYKDVQILDNDITDVWGFTGRGGLYDNTGGVYVDMLNYQGSLTQVDGLLIEGNYFADNRCIALHVKAPKIYLDREDLWATNLKISQNIFQGSGADHIVVNGAKGALIECNAGYDAGLGSLSTYDEETHIAGMWSAYHTRDFVFQFNEVARTRNNNLNNGRKGDSQAFDVDLGTWGKHVFQYNYTHENEGGVLILMPDPTREKVAYYRYNLSVNDGRRTNTGSQFSMHPYPPLSYAHVHNNVFYSTHPDGFRFRDYAGAYYHNNVFHVTKAIYPTAPVFSNNAYHGHVPDVNDPYKVVGDPLFVGPLPTGPAADGYALTNTQIFKLQANSPLINAGKSIGLLGAPGDEIDNGGRDFWGNPLYAGGHADIGLHEYVGGAALPPAPVVIVDNPAGASVTYAGPWTYPTNDENFHLSTKSMTSGVGAYVLHTFTGDNIGVYGAMGPNMGMVLFTLDNGASVLADCYWPVPRYRVPLHQFTGLANVSHTLRATVMPKNPAASSNLVAIDYFQRAPVAPAAGPLVTTIDAAPGAGKVYTGAWTHATTDAHPSELYYARTRSVSATVGAYADFTFTGAGVRLFGTKGGGFGKINVSIDGGAATTVNCYQDLVDEFQIRLFEAANLSPGTHTLRVTVAAKDPASTANTIALDLIQVIAAPAGGGAGVDIIQDNTDSTGVTLSGAWSASTSVTGFYGGNYVSSPADTTNTARYTPTIPEAGTYEVFARWTELYNRAGAVPYEITSANGTVTVSKDQRAQGGQWVSLGVYPFNAGTSGNVLIRSTATDGYTIADAVRFTRQLPQPVDIVVDASDPTGVAKTADWIASTTTPGYHGADALNDGNTNGGEKTVLFTPDLPASGTYEVFAWWPAGGNRSPGVPFKITHAGGDHTVDVDQRTNGGQWYSLGTYTFNAGTGGCVLITNTYTGPLPKPAQCYVIADAVRFVRQ